MHCHKYRGPMQRLRPDKTQTLLAVFGVSPPRDDTNEPDERRQNDPICRYGCLGETRVRNTKDRKDQHQEVGPLPYEKGARVESPSVRCGIVWLWVHHCSKAQPCKQREAVRLDAHEAPPRTVTASRRPN